MWYGVGEAPRKAWVGVTGDLTQRSQRSEHREHRERREKTAP
jgi:hypothetical protein